MAVAVSVESAEYGRNEAKPLFADAKGPGIIEGSSLTCARSTPAMNLAGESLAPEPEELDSPSLMVGSGELLWLLSDFGPCVGARLSPV